MTDTLRATLPTGEVIDLEIPEPPPVEWAVPDSPELVELVERLVAQGHHLLEPLPIPGSFEAPTDPVERAAWDRELADRIHSLLVDSRPPREAEIVELRHLSLRLAAQSPAVTPAGLVKLMLASGQFYARSHLVEEFGVQHHVTGRPSLLEIAVLLDDCGFYGADAVLEAYASYRQLSEGWADDAVWPFFARHLDKLFALPGSPGTYGEGAAAFSRALRSFPVLPDVVVDRLYDMALGANPGHRKVAQEFLSAHHDRTRRVVAALSDRRSAVRIAAAEWLATIRDPGTVPALERAWERERNATAKAAIRSAYALLRIGVADRPTPDELNRTAAKAAGKPPPKALAWFPWDAMPQVRWAGTDEEVPRDTLVWLITEAVQLKSPEPDALWLAYCQMFRTDDRERFGRFLLEAWLTEDVRPLPEDEAFQRARQEATSLHRQMTANPSWYRGTPEFGLTVEELTQRFFTKLLARPVGSAISSKGLLAVVAACAGPDVVPAVERYLSKWHGRRANQCKALLAMLSWIDHPLAIQLLLSVADRFRTRGIQEEARRLAEALAERRGATTADLADRSIPTAGFDQHGRLELSYGDRVFTATLTPELTIELRNPEGKEIRSLPSPRGSDDEERAKAAKQALSAAKQELKTIVTLQTTRLYEAMCTGRTWRVDNWRRYLAEHPVMRHLVRRLVWTATWEPNGAVSFRLLEDGSCTDADDNEVTLPEGSTIRLAHDTNLSADEVARWGTHLADYGVTPLFDQLGKPVFRLAPERHYHVAIRDFDGYAIEAFRLHRHAMKRGYLRGPALDAGFIYDYRKHFPTLGITTVIRFSGHRVDEKNESVHLKELVFHRGESDTPMPLGEVPAVLLSEAWNDLRQIANGAIAPEQA